MSKQQAPDPEPLMSYPKCPVCNGKCGWEGGPGAGWLPCQACGGVGSTAKQIKQAEAEVGAAHRAWRARRNISEFAKPPATPTLQPSPDPKT